MREPNLNEHELRRSEFDNSYTLVASINWFASGDMPSTEIRKRIERLRNFLRSELAKK